MKNLQLFNEIFIISLKILVLKMLQIMIKAKNSLFFFKMKGIVNYERKNQD